MRKTHAGLPSVSLSDAHVWCATAAVPTMAIMPRRQQTVHILLSIIFISANDENNKFFFCDAMRHNSSDR